MDSKPGTSPEALKQFFAAAVRVVGAQWVRTAADDVAPFGWVAIPFENEVLMPVGVVSPGSVE